MVGRAQPSAYSGTVGSAWFMFSAPSAETLSERKMREMYSRFPPSEKKARAACQRKFVVGLVSVGLNASPAKFSMSPPAYVRSNSPMLVMMSGGAWTGPKRQGPTNPVVVVLTPSMILLRNDVSSTNTPGARYSGMAGDSYLGWVDVVSEPEARALRRDKVR